MPGGHEGWPVPGGVGALWWLCLTKPPWVAIVLRAYSVRSVSSDRA